MRRMQWDNRIERRRQDSAGERAFVLHHRLSGSDHLIYVSDGLSDVSNTVCEILTITTNASSRLTLPV